PRAPALQRRAFARGTPARPLRHTDLRRRAVSNGGHAAGQLHSRVKFMTRLAQRVAVLTGAATGIGRALASRLAEEGAALCLADINRDALEETASALASRGASVSTHVVDVADGGQVENFAREVAGRHGPAD